MSLRRGYERRDRRPYGACFACAPDARTRPSERTRARFTGDQRCWRTSPNMRWIAASRSWEPTTTTTRTAWRAAPGRRPARAPRSSTGRFGDQIPRMSRIGALRERLQPGRRPERRPAPTANSDRSSWPTACRRTAAELVTEHARREPTARAGDAGAVRAPRPHSPSSSWAMSGRRGRPLRAPSR
jgi:hypothetical protein